MSRFGDHWHMVTDTMLPRAVCYADTGCSAGVVADHQVFLSKPVNVSTGAIPVFSVHQLTDNSWVGTMGILGSSNAADTTTIRMEKNNVDPSQPINFTINSANLGAAGPNMYVTAQADLANLTNSSEMYYTITSTASMNVSAMTITPTIWRKNSTAGVLVYTGDTTSCSAATKCIVTGNFTPHKTAYYYANATVLYTMPTNAAVPKVAVIAGRARVTSSSTINYYVFADGVGMYHGFESNKDLPSANKTAQYFYNHMTDASRCEEYNDINYCWNTRNNPVDDDTGSKYWNKSESAGSKGANNAEFVFHSGHGWNDGILFGTANKFYKMYRTDMKFSQAKWVALDSCSVLNESTWTNWKSVFDGMHILMSFNTIGVAADDLGPEFVERMRGGNYEGTQYSVVKITEAWKRTLKHIIHDKTYDGAYMYAESSQDDILPDYGDFTEPTKNRGSYTIKWVNFSCEA